MLPIHKLEGNQLAGVVHVRGQRVAFTRHVIDRYRERVKPALTLGLAAADFVLLAKGCGVIVPTLAWAHTLPGGEQSGLSRDTERWLMIGDDIAISLITSTRGGWLAGTCVTRGGISEITRNARSRGRRRHTVQTAKSGRVREGRARARAKAMSEQQELRWVA